MEVKTVILAAAISAIAFGSAKQQDDLSSFPQESVRKTDLKKIKWIEGKWKGMYQGKPFYEIYQFTNDTTLQIIGYEWDGKDSSKSSKSFVYWKGGNFYLGDEMNWKVTSISNKKIKMLANNKAYNDILWEYHDNKSWKAILTTNKGVTEYHMELFDPFKKTNK